MILKCGIKYSYSIQGYGDFVESCSIVVFDSMIECEMN